MAAGLFLLTAGNSFAQAECSGGLCGTPNQSGGGCGCGCGCSILVAMTDRGDTYQFADDFDGDGIEDEFDNCPFASNFDQMDNDSDTSGDACDLCVNVADTLQSDLDEDGMGDACDTDMDGDSVLNSIDNCSSIPNPTQVRTLGGAGAGDACNDDDDGDSVLDSNDNCRLVYNPTQNTVTTGCDDDPDSDGVDSALDNCPTIHNPERDISGAQRDLDGNGIGDACDMDMDGDGVPNFRDNCRDVSNPSQLDVDHDGLGDNMAWGSVNGLESCDPRECYVVAGQSGCLDPLAAFTIRIGLIGLPTELKVGDDITLQMFTNRLGEMHRWSARFERVPDGSEAVLENAKSSSVTLADSPQLGNCLRQASDGSCEEFNNLKFTPDEPGTYKVKVNINLASGNDPMGLGSAAASATATIQVGGESAGGCAAGASSAMGAMALGLVALLRRRRK
jgi:uncharacterized protein (TIGR03382 family)